MGARFEIRRSRRLRKLFRQSWWVATIGNNNEILQTSEMLSSKQDCIDNINAIRSIFSTVVHVIDVEK